MSIGTNRLLLEDCVKRWRSVVRHWQRPSTTREADWRNWVRALGETVCCARRLAGLSQVALADRAGISQGAVSRLENGQGADAPLCSVMGILGALADSLRSLPREAVPDDVLWLIDVPQLAPWSPADTPPSGGDLQLKALIERHRAMPPADRDLFVRAALAPADALDGKSD